MKTCMHCGSMISPHPLHKDVKGICSVCMNEDFGIEVPDDPVNDGPRPKIRGKHVIVQKSQTQILIEKRKKELGRRYY